MIFFLPLLQIIFFVVVVGPFWVAWQIVRGFVASTSTGQIPAIVARRLARQRRIADAGRWYIEALSSPASMIVAGKSLFGLRAAEVPRFLGKHGASIPPETREVLSNISWANAFVSHTASDLQLFASDNAALIDLANRLVASAHKPKQPERLKWLQECAKLCEATAQQLASALRQDLRLPTRYFLKPVGSSLQPNGASAGEVRTGTGTCSQCGTVDMVKGLDAYAEVRFGFQGSTGTSSYTYYRYRYLGWFDVRFCEQCLPEATVRESIDRWARQAKFSGAAALLAVVSLLVLSLTTAVPFWVSLLTGAVGMVALIYLVVCLQNVLRPTRNELQIYRKRVDQFLTTQKDELLTCCDLSGSVLNFRGQRFDPTLEHVSFVVEPTPGKHSKADDSGTLWMT